MKIIKTLFVLAIVALISFGAQSQNDAISHHFKKYVDDSRFKTVFISPKMFQIVESMDLNSQQAEAIKAVVQDMESIRILSTLNNGSSIYDEATSTLQSNNKYELLVNVQDQSQGNVQFLLHEGLGNKDELVLIANGSDKSFVLMSFIGDIDLNKISQLAAAFEK